MGESDLLCLEARDSVWLLTAPLNCWRCINSYFHFDIVVEEMAVLQSILHEY